MRDFTDDLRSLRSRLEEARGYLKVDAARPRVAELEGLASEPGLWDDPNRARAITSELSSLQDDLTQFDGLAQRLDDVATLDEMAREMGDETQEEEIDAELRALAVAFSDLELRSLFAGDYDEHDAICQVQSGEGGVDAQDWAEMLVRMYQRWAERHGFGFELDEASPGTEAGLSSATFIVSGRHAYGWLRSEQGVHRLVRMSPFDSAHRRQTSFASIDVTPLIEDAGEVQIDEKDLRIDTYRSSGAGGQHVNVTDSAVRITHLPTNIVVSCQNERSQTQNKARAMQVLASKLAEVQREQRKAELQSIAGTSASASMGNQIRSYVLAPYQQVKDLRTNHEVGNVQGVLDGDLDDLMAAFLRWERATATG
ncbi:MAG TPA: peptide chain release factor 2 [Acidimicrobiales bacterium]|nr:peptide chain release factor 2 [Acidimicrobiales bacterium]